MRSHTFKCALCGRWHDRVFRPVEHVLDWPIARIKGLREIEPPTEGRTWKFCDDDCCEKFIPLLKKAIFEYEQSQGSLLTWDAAQS